MLAQKELIKQQQIQRMDELAKQQAEEEARRPKPQPRKKQQEFRQLFSKTQKQPATAQPEEEEYQFDNQGPMSLTLAHQFNNGADDDFELQEKISMLAGKEETGRQEEEAEEQDEDEEAEEEEQQPLLFVDINLGGDEQERIVVFEGDTAPELARVFCEEHNLDEETREKLEELLEQQMAGILPKIDEDEDSDDEINNQ